jgi:predicted Zn-ribbon and HTH transcriptional regulator
MQDLQKPARRLIIKQCHVCTTVIETTKEPDKCPKCKKSYLPVNYFQKVHDQSKNYDDLFCDSDELHEDDLIKGLYVLW